SDFRGYWLFGFLIGDLGELQIDLLSRAVGNAGTPIGAARRRAAETFVDQARKAGLTSSQVQSARLTLRRLPGAFEETVPGRARAGYGLELSAEAVMASGKRYRRDQVVFVAPHDP